MNCYLLLTGTNYSAWGRITGDGHTPNEIFSTSATYWILTGEEEPGMERDMLRAFERLWLCHSPRRVQAIVRKLLKEIMSTKDNLSRRGSLHQQDDLTCRLCSEDDETQSHLFFKCNFATEIWNLCYKWFKIDMVPHNVSYRNLLQYGNLFGNEKKEKKVTTLLASIIWAISKVRKHIPQCSS